MIHYSCDRCKRIIDPTREPHYRVRVEAQPVLDPLITGELEDDRDHLAEISQALDAAELDEQFESSEAFCRGYDLCPDCYQRFARDPLAVERALHLGFSHN
jgi:hypothetical protein